MQVKVGMQVRVTKHIPCEYVTIGQTYVVMSVQSKQVYLKGTNGSTFIALHKVNSNNFSVVA